MASKLVRAGSSYLRKLNQNSNVATRHVHRYLCPTTFAIAPKFHQSDFQRQSASLIQLRQYSEKPSIKSQIDELVQSKPVVVFMKGTPEKPLCGFSNAVVQILRMHGVPNYEAYNVLEDEELRQGIKDYSNWPTIPQVYMGGEFVGGCDIMIDMHKNGELIEELKKVGIKSDLEDE